VYLPDLVEVAKEFPDYFDIGRGCGNFVGLPCLDRRQGFSWRGRGHLDDCDSGNLSFPSLR